MKPGDRVEILKPHHLAGQTGEVVRVYRANAHYEPRADVSLDVGWQMIANRMLRVISPTQPPRSQQSGAYTVGRKRRGPDIGADR